MRVGISGLSRGAIGRVRDGLGQLGSVLVESALEWWRDNALQWGAALAFYSALSLSPLLILTLALFGPLFGRAAVKEEIAGQVQQLVGPAGADVVEMVMHNASQPGLGGPAAVVGLVTMVVGATAVFAQLQAALNHIWHVQPKPGRRLRQTVRVRTAAFGLVLAVGLLLLASTLLSAVVSAVLTTAGEYVPLATRLTGLLDPLVSFLLAVLLFALVYRVLPDVEISWRWVGGGATLTALLFTLGKGLVGFYLGSSGIASAYGAAGSLVALLMWVYYSAQAFLFGAEMTQVIARRSGSEIVPAGHAVWTPVARRVEDA